MSKQTKLTKLRKEIIPIELIGQNIRYRVLKNPIKPAYPRGDEIKYFDNYVLGLNDVYSLNDILGERTQEIAKGTRNSIASIVMGSPLNNTEGENTLAYMLMSSAQAGEWQPFVIDVPYLTDTSIATAKEYLGRVESISSSYNKGMICGGILFGLAVAKRGGLTLPLEYDNKVIVIPSQTFIEYIAQQK